MKKPYIKRYKNVAGFSVWIVDGDYIRTNINEEFTNFGQHYRFDFIPKNEFWIDKEYGGGNEAEFYIDDMLNINKFMSQGVSHKEAIRRVNIIERKERKKSEFFRKNVGRAEGKTEEIKRVKKELIKKYSKGVKVWVVNGELVRDLFFLDFTEGGHDKIYNFIPDREIWIDDDVSPKERKFILLHEIHERNLINKGLDYNFAHRLSSREEFYYRHHQEKLDEKLKEETEKCQ